MTDPATTPTATPPAKPPRERKARAPKPPKIVKERKKPRTLLARVRDMSPHHEYAFTALRKKDAGFEAALRAALDHDAELVEAKDAIVKAQTALEAASAAHTALLAKGDAAKATIARLDSTAEWYSKA